MRGSQNFHQEGGGGGGPRQSDKKALTTLFFKEKYHFSKSGGGTNFSRGGGGGVVRLFPGGVHCLFPIEAHIACDFPGGFQTPCPPLDPHLAAILSSI